jgi:hypothetical protein
MHELLRLQTRVSNEQITVVAKDFRCPECGSPLEPFDYGRQRFGLRFLSIGVVGVLLFAVGAIVCTLFFSAKPPVPLSSVEVTAAATPTGDRGNGTRLDKTQTNIV